MKHKIAVAAAVVAFLVITAAFWVGGIIMEGSTSDAMLQGELIDYVIITDCRKSRRDTVLQSRIDAAVEYLRGHSLCMVVCSENFPIGNSYAELVSDKLKKRGIPERRILKTEGIADDYDNFNSIKQLLDERKGGTPYRVLVITNEFSAYRTRRLLYDVGFESPKVMSAVSRSIDFYTGLLKEMPKVVYLHLKAK